MRRSLQSALRQAQDDKLWLQDESLNVRDDSLSV